MNSNSVNQNRHSDLSDIAIIQMHFAFMHNLKVCIGQRNIPIEELRVILRTSLEWMKGCMEILRDNFNEFSMASSSYDCCALEIKLFDSLIVHLGSQGISVNQYKDRIKEISNIANAYFKSDKFIYCRSIYRTVDSPISRESLQYLLKYTFSLKSDSGFSSYDQGIIDAKETINKLLKGTPTVGNLAFSLFESCVKVINDECYEISFVTEETLDYIVGYNVTCQTVIDRMLKPSIIPPVICNSEMGTTSFLNVFEPVVISQDEIISRVKSAIDLKHLLGKPISVEETLVEVCDRNLLKISDTDKREILSRL